MSWTNVYCCCRANTLHSTGLAQTAATHQSAVRQSGKPCCAGIPAPPLQQHQQSEQRQPVRQDCNECKFFAIRQNTLVETAHRDAPALSLCAMSESLVLTPLACTLVETAGAWSDSIKIPTALLDLNTCLLR